MTTKLERITFSIGRETEYFTDKELARQIGHGRAWWPVALLKELLDNALDACEATGVAPVIEVAVGPDGFSVQDNGTGLPHDVIARSLDYSRRISDKAYYVSPTRGQLGNALKVIWAAGYVAGGEGLVEVWTGGQRHSIVAHLDRIAQRPEVEHLVCEDPLVKTGTRIRVSWPDSASSLAGAETGDFYNPTPPTALHLVEDYAALNPQATLRSRDTCFSATDPDFNKWRPSNPTSPHWYTADTLRDLIAGYIVAERDGGRAITVRGFVSQFRGLSGTAKQRRVTAGLSGAYLHDLADQGALDDEAVADLLAAMQAQAKPPKPASLGPVGRAHLTAWMTDVAGVAPDSVKYIKRAGDEAGMPWIVEVAFGVRADEEEGRRVVSGLNWSPLLGAPVQQVAALLSEMRVDGHDPVTVVAHLVRPRFEFTDHGKTHVQLPGSMEEALSAALRSVAKKWKKAKQAADRRDRVSRRALEQMRVPRFSVTIKDAAYGAMEAAYEKASGGGHYPANARQIYYAVRPTVLAEASVESLDSQYFTQTLLKDYMDEYSPDWNVVYDARGHLTEPHGRGRDREPPVGLGGAAVRKYTQRFTGADVEETPIFPSPQMLSTVGPELRFSGVLFIEKEGFNPILEASGIANRYDLAVASTKGMPVSAVCDLLGTMDVPVYVVRDFDKAGFSIVAALQWGTRGSQCTPSEVIDLGLRLEDIEGLERESVSYSQKEWPGLNLEGNGATEEEIEVLVARRGKWNQGWEGERVELNAMTSDQFVAWLERKLEERGVQKVIPSEEVLNSAFRRALFLQQLDDAQEELAEEIRQREPVLLDDLRDQVERLIKAKSKMSWDEAVWQVAEQAGLAGGGS